MELGPAEKVQYNAKQNNKSVRTNVQVFNHVGLDCVAIYTGGLSGLAARCERRI